MVQRSIRIAVALSLCACALLAVAGPVYAIASGRLCITSPERLENRYEGSLHTDSAAVISDRSSDADSDGVPDNDDILAAALAYVQTRPHYKSVYYPSGYSDDEYGVCTDVAAIACRAAGYDLQALIAADVAVRPDAYAIEVPDSAIDFRRTPNLKVFFDQHAHCLTTDVSEVSEWRGGDIVLYDGHVGIVSDRRNVEGVPYLIHHSGPFQLRYEEDRLRSYGRIVGHYRVDRACLDLLS